MQDKPESILALDIGMVRIGVARASAIAKLPEPLETITVDGSEIEKIKQFIEEYKVDTIVAGLPQNLEGSDTQQTKSTREFVEKLKGLVTRIDWQDERLSSVRAKEELRQRKGEHSKGDVDSLAATYILEDYIRDKLS